MVVSLGAKKDNDCFFLSDEHNLMVVSFYLMNTTMKKNRRKIRTVGQPFKASADAVGQPFKASAEAVGHPFRAPVEYPVLKCPVL